MDYLHSRQPSVIHRDIKPRNILLANRSGNSVGDVYLVDFGSVQTMVKAGGTRTVVGTYGYMSPEQFGGRAFPSSDLYSLGATLIYLVTTKHPSELLDDDLDFQFNYINHISPELKEWLRLMTQTSLNHRFSSVDKALQALENLSGINLVNWDQSPINTIKFKRTDEKLEIILSQYHTIENFYAIITLFFLVLILLFPALIYLLLIDRVFTVPVFTVCIVVLDILFIISTLLIIFFDKKKIKIFLPKVRISIEKKTMVITIKKFDHVHLFASPITIIPINNIWRLVSTRNNYKLINTYGKIQRTEKPPNLIIWVGISLQYGLNSYLHQPLTLPERNWIAQEISNFLDIPLIEE